MININIDELPETKTFELIPKGWYKGNVADQNLHHAQTGAEILNLKIQLSTPEHAGRVVYGRLYTSGPSAKALEYGLGQLRAIMVSGGLKQLSDWDQLVGIPVKVYIKIVSDEKWGDKNEASMFAPVNGSASISTKQQPKSQTKSAQKPAEDDDSDPWS